MTNIHIYDIIYSNINILVDISKIKDVDNMSNHKDVELYYSDKAKQIMFAMPDYVKQYIRAIHNRTSPRTQYEYLKDIQTFMDYSRKKFNKVNITVSDLNKYTKTDFEEYFEYLEHYEKNDKTYSNSRISIKRKMSALRHFFAYLFENDMIKSDDIRKVEIPKIYNKEIIRLEKTEKKYFLNQIKRFDNMTTKEKQYHKLQIDRDLAIVYLLLSTGIRVSECTEIDMSDLNIKDCSVRITRKGGNESIVYFSDEAAEYIKEYLNWRYEQTDIETDALFLSSRKTRLCARAIEIIIKKYAQKAIPNKHITPHKLRATYATDLYNATGDIYLVAENLGHKDITTTKNHYANLSNKRKSENRNKIKIDDNE